MDRDKPYSNAFDEIDNSNLRELAGILAEREGRDPEKVFRELKRYRYKVMMDVEEFGEADMFGIGRLVKDKGKGGLTFIRYSEEESNKRQQLMLQQELGGQAGNIGSLPSKEFNVKIDFNFPIKEMVELMAEQRGVPDDKLKRKFDEQLKEAYLQLMETGEGILPDFGRIRCTDITNLKDMTFDFYDEMYEIFEAVTNSKQEGEQ